MSEAIRISDLAQPQLSELQKAALAYGEKLAIDWWPQSILNDARTKTGLIDFGPMDFLDRLTLLCDEWGNDHELTGIGQLSLRNKLLQFAVNRLLIQDMLNRHPEIHDIAIERPIIVAGLPRSGTTHLLNLLAADSRLRALPLWESYEPVPMPGEAPSETGANSIGPRYRRCADQWAMMQQMTPHLAAMHPMNPDHIHEELELMGPDFASYNFEWLSHSPKWRDHYYAHDQTPHYEYMKTVLKVLLWQQRNTGRPTRWVLKCPQHLEQLPVLKNVFPDATLVVTHRDPVAVIQSTITMLAYGQRINRKRVLMRELVDYWSDRIEHLLRACVRDRALWPAECSVDVPFHQFMTDEAGTLERIYATAGLPLNEQARAEHAAFMAEHPRGKHGHMVYDLRGDFGVDPDTLRERFAFYFSAFPVQAEAAS